MEVKRVGKRKYNLAIIFAAMLTFVISVMSFVSDGFKLSGTHILCAGLAYGVIIGAIIYGYKYEYKFRKDE